MNVTNSESSINRRRFERFSLQPMYTPLTVCLRDNTAFEGHTYDISEGGVQFELDHPLPAGTPVAMEIKLPARGNVPVSIEVLGNVIWADESEPGPVRMAAAFTAFAIPHDREVLLKHLGAGRARAA
jgi:hypothetical protein